MQILCWKEGNRTIPRPLPTEHACVDWMEPLRSVGFHELSLHSFAYAMLIAPFTIQIVRLIVGLFQRMQKNLHLVSLSDLYFFLMENVS